MHHEAKATWLFSKNSISSLALANSLVSLVLNSSMSSPADLRFVLYILSIFIEGRKRLALLIPHIVSSSLIRNHNYLQSVISRTNFCF